MGQPVPGPQTSEGQSLLPQAVPQVLLLAPHGSTMHVFPVLAPDLVLIERPLPESGRSLKTLVEYIIVSAEIKMFYYFLRERQMKIERLNDNFWKGPVYLRL